MRIRRSALLVAALPLLLPPAAQAQDGFLFGPPKAQITLRAGPNLLNASGDIYDEFTDDLTLGRGDFRAPAVALELGIVAHDHFDVVLGAGWSQRTTRSEYREFVEEGPSGEDVPIQQTTQLRTIPLYGMVRYYPRARGEAVSGLAWVPSTVLPYASAGVGMVLYRLRQDGDFVSPSSLEIFTDLLESSESTPSMHFAAGLDYWMNARLGINAEARYTHASASLRSDFQSYEEIDLSGFQAGIGLTLRW